MQYDLFGNKIEYEDKKEDLDIEDYIKNDFESVFSFSGFKKQKSKSKNFEKAKNNFYFFCSYYLKDYFDCEFAPYQKTIVKILNTRFISDEDYESIKTYLRKDEYTDYIFKNKKINGIIDCEPRNFGKSVRMSLAYPLWCLLYKKEKFILMFASNKELAQMQIFDIKQELLNNEKIINDFGYSVKNLRNNYIELKNNCVIYSIGYGSSVRGIRNKQHRPSLIILDDVCNEKNTNSTFLRQRLYKWFKRTVLPLSKDAFLIMVNTLINRDDLTSNLLDEIKQDVFEDFIGLRFACYDKNGESLWQSRWDDIAIKKKEKELGYHAFLSEMLNEPPLKDNLISRDWIKEYKNIDAKDIFIGIDPSAGAHDRSAMVVLGKVDNLYYVLDFFNQSIDPNKFVDIVIDYYKKYNPKLCVFESTGFQEGYRKMIVQKGLSVNLKIELRGIKPKQSKQERLKDIIFLLENERVFFKNKNNELVYQLLDFPISEYDDLVDAFVYSIMACELETKILKIF